MRFDLAIDDNLRVFLMEANMSPNLSSAHFLPNQLLYEQVIFNLLNLVGVGSTLHRESLRKRWANPLYYSKIQDIPDSLFYLYSTVQMMRKSCSHRTKILLCMLMFARRNRVLDRAQLLNVNCAVHACHPAILRLSIPHTVSTSIVVIPNASSRHQLDMETHSMEQLMINFRTKIV